MYNPRDPPHVLFSPGGNPGALAYAPSLESSQVSVISSGERNYVFVVPQHLPGHFSGPPSTSNSCADYSGSRQRSSEGSPVFSSSDVVHAPSAPSVLYSGNGNTASAQGAYSLVNTANSSPQNSVYKLTPVSGATAFSAPYAGTSASSGGTPPSGMQPHYFLQSQAPTSQHQQQQPQAPHQTFLASAGGSNSGAVQARQTFMLIPTDAASAPLGPFYSLQPSSPPHSAPAAAASAGTSTGVPRLHSPFQLSSPTPQSAGAVPGQVTYILNPNTGSTLMPLQVHAESYLGFPGPNWGHPTSSNTVSRDTPPQQPSFSPNRSTATSRRTATPAAIASSGPLRPAALGVRSFMAPQPVGTCIVRDAPLIPTVPPLALPRPAWGRLPASA